MIRIARIFILLSAFFLIFTLQLNASKTAEEDSGKLILNFEGELMEAYRSAMGLYWKGDYKSAESVFVKISEGYPEFASAYIYLADCLYAQGNKQGAHDRYEKACQILKKKAEMRGELVPDAKEPEIYSDMVYCLNAMGRYDEAKKQGLLGTLSGQSPDLYVNLAYTFYKLDNPKAAQSNLCKSQKITEPKELRNLTYLRITDLFEEGTEWASGCEDDSAFKSMGTNYALIIAVGKYRDSKINPLNYAENDAREIYRVLTGPRTGLFKPENVTILINEEATEKNIKFKFDDMVLKADSKEDLFFVFYAGHGFTYPNGSDTYWLSYDTMVGNEEGNRIKSTAFSNLTLATKIADIEADTIVFFVDACFSSGMVAKPTAIRGLDSYLGSGKDYVIITSSQADQTSIESPRLKHGLFSYFLIKGLSGEADIASDGFVGIEEIWPFVKLHVSEHAKSMGAEQYPRRSGSSGASIYLSRNPNY